MSFIKIVVGGVDDFRLRMLLLLATSFLSLLPLFLVDDDDNDDDDDDASPTALNGRFLFAALNISDGSRSTSQSRQFHPAFITKPSLCVVIAAREWS
jgi:hypothetical protein